MNQGHLIVRLRIYSAGTIGEQAAKPAFGFVVFNNCSGVENLFPWIPFFVSTERMLFDSCSRDS